MAWLNKRSNREIPGTLDIGKHTFDVPVKLRVRGVAEPVHAMLLHIALAGCRLRSWMLLERGAGISFDWRLSSGKLLSINGVVAARYAPRNGGVGFEYAVALEELPEADADELAREAAMLARRSASARSYDTSLVDISQFTGFRVPDEFELTYRIDDPRVTPKRAQACDVMGNGLRLRCDETLKVNQQLVLQFRLPEHVLNVHKGKDDDLVIGPFGYRRVPLKYMRRPFAELRLKARVTAVAKDSKRRDCYDVEFVDADGMAREELARYIHAAQLAQIKR